MKYTILLLIILIQNCARAPLESKSESMRRTQESINLIDELDDKSLVKAVVANAKYLSSINRTLHFGERKISSKQYAKALRVFIKILEMNVSKEKKDKLIKEKFEIYETYGRDEWSQVLVTSYYTPVIKGRRRRSRKYSQPLYSKPNDLVKVDVRSYRKMYDDFKVTSKETEINKFRGRVTKNGMVVPYWKRAEIDFQGKLKGKKLEIAWVDPVEAFFLQIQGSGKVDLPGKRDIYVHYADQNGHEFYPIGKELLDVIPLEEMSMDKIKEHLRNNANKEERERILSTDPSYVFFRREVTRPISSLGIEVHSNRTVATDVRYYSNGTLGFLKFNDNKTPSRFVLDQDTGGGLKGRGRVDLYAGEGNEAGKFASGFKEHARLFYLVPRDAI